MDSICLGIYSGGLSFATRGKLDGFIYLLLVAIFTCVMLLIRYYLYKNNPK